MNSVSLVFILLQFNTDDYSMEVTVDLDLPLNAAQLDDVASGIKKLQIVMTIEDDLISIDNLIEDYLTSEPNNKYIQSCDIVAVNKIFK